MLYFLRAVIIVMTFNSEINMKQIKIKDFFPHWAIELLSWVLVFVIGFVVAYIITHFVILKTEIVSGSMETTIMTTEHVCGNRLAYLFSDPKRGDVVFFQYPYAEEEAAAEGKNPEDIIYIKRIIGLPGETVHIRDGAVYIDDNEEPLDEPYVNGQRTSDRHSKYIDVVIPDNFYFVMGDNREVSSDSRSWGFVPRYLIKARAWLIYWPFDSLRTLDEYTYSIDE